MHKYRGIPGRNILTSLVMLASYPVLTRKSVLLIRMLREPPVLLCPRRMGAQRAYATTALPPAGVRRSERACRPPEVLPVSTVADSDKTGPCSSVVRHARSWAAPAASRLRRRRAPSLSSGIHSCAIII